MRRRPIVLCLSLVLTALSGCTDPTATPNAAMSPAPAASSGGQFALAWKQDLSGRAQGVAVPPNGDVYLSVNASYDGLDPFTEGGGAMVFSSKGAKLRDIPTLLPKDCDACIRLIFAPNAPQVASQSVLLSNYNWGVFKLDTATQAATRLAIDTNNLSTSITGVDSNSAISADGSMAFLAGSRLGVLNLGTGRLERMVDFGHDVKQIVPASGSAYLVNLTENLDSKGTLALWNPTTDARSTFETAYPVRGIAARDSWAVGVVESGLSEYQVVQWDLAQNPPVEKNLGGFRMSGGNELRMAVRPGKRQVAIGTAGISAVNDGTITLLAGSTVFIDADKGTIGRADTSSVQGLSFSPDGGMLYVADTGGLKAFALP
ncbi:MAG TPA: hypothetical protein V6D05_16530 [Stenomitos sp.]